MKLTIGHPCVIHMNPVTIALQVDLQSTVIFSKSGEAIGWVHQQAKTIDFSISHELELNIIRYTSPMYELWADYSITRFEIDGNSSTRKWCIQTKFIYPHNHKQYLIDSIAEMEAFIAQMKAKVHADELSESTFRCYCGIIDRKNENIQAFKALLQSQYNTAI